MSASNFTFDLFESERMKSGKFIRQFIIDNYNNLYEFIESNIFMCFLFILNVALYYYYHSLEHHFIVSRCIVRMVVSIVTILITIGVTFGSYYIIVQVANKIDDIKMEKEELEEQLTVVMDENTMLKNKLIEYETFIQDYNRKRISSSSDEDFSKLNIVMDDLDGGDEKFGEDEDEDN